MIKNVTIREIQRFFLEEKKNSERISTLNNMGGMSRTFDIVINKFINFVIKNRCNPSFKILEIGAAYGDVALKCLKKGAINYLINDLDRRHIEIFKIRTQKEKINPCAFTVSIGDFPNSVKLSSSYDAILISRVLHFFEPEKWLSALNRLFRLLKPRGQVFVTVISPYVRPFIPFLECYQQQKNKGNLFPGYIENIFKELHIPRTIELSQNPYCHFPQLNLMCKDILTRHFENIGFEVVESLEYSFTYDTSIWKYNGREMLGLIARKK